MKKLVKRNYNTRRTGSVDSDPARSSRTGEVICIGIDAHKKDHFISMRKPGEEKPIEWRVANEAGAVRKMIRKILREHGSAVLACYEAGPCGYALQRWIEAAGMRCIVVAPSLIPVKPGERVKTDRRDARKLAELLMAGLLTEVVPPAEDEEAVRDLCRYRCGVQKDLTRCRHRMSKFLLRRGIFFREGNNWTDKHRRWLKRLEFKLISERIVFAEALQSIELNEEKLKSLDGEVEFFARQEVYSKYVNYLRCFRGIDTVSAMVILTELHGIERFRHPRNLSSYIGLVPGEHSSGERTFRGPITRAGSPILRRIIIEAAQQYRRRPAVGYRVKARRAGQPDWVIEIADKAIRRLYRRFWHLANNGKDVNKAVTAVARELTAFIWDVLYRAEIAAAA